MTRWDEPSKAYSTAVPAVGLLRLVNGDASNVRADGNMGQVLVVDRNSYI